MIDRSAPIHVGLLPAAVAFHFPWEGRSYRDYVEQVTRIVPTKDVEPEGMVWWNVPRPPDVAVIRGWADTMSQELGRPIWYRCSVNDGHRDTVELLACPACSAEAEFQARKKAR